MQALAVIFSTDMSCLLMKKISSDPEQWTCPIMDVPTNKDPMLFVYEAAKEACGASIINTQMWFLKTEKCIGNSYINIDHDFYIGTGILNTASILKEDTKYEWVPLKLVSNWTLNLVQKALTSYIDEAVYLFSYLANLQ